MAVKRPTHPPKHTAKAHKAVSDLSHDDESKENHRPPVTQVVEVVEDQESSESVTAVADAGSDSGLLEEPLDSRDSDTESISTEHAHREYQREDVAREEDVEEKRRVLVDELFQKKDPVDSEVMPEISAHSRSSKRSIFVWAFVIILTSLVAGVVIMLASGNNMGITLPAFGPTPTPTPTGTPTPTPTPDVSKLDRATISIQVLNGSGTSGAAGKMKTALEESGFTVKDTANAQNYDYEKTEIIVKEDKKDYIPLLEEDLKKLYTLAPSVSTLDEDVPYDVRIIVGKED